MGGATRGEKLALWWTNSSVVWAVAICVLILVRSGLQPRVLSVHTLAGLALWGSGALAALGAGGLGVSRHRQRLGAVLLCVYSFLWVAALCSGLAWLWRAGAEWSVCLKSVNVCITGWWARGILAVGVVPFVLTSAWFWGRARMRQSGA
jgi:hypothetical protein